MGGRIFRILYADGVSHKTDEVLTAVYVTHVLKIMGEAEYPRRQLSRKYSIIIPPTKVRK